MVHVYPTEISRRTAIGLVAAAGLGWPNVDAFETQSSAFISAYSEGEGNFGVALLTGEGNIIAKLPLPSRGHGAVRRPNTSHAVLFARRPGEFAVIIDTVGGINVDKIYSATNRHFFGHGAFSHDSRLLYATENDVPGGRGVIGVYDAEDKYRRVGEMPSHGIGPHELVLMPDGLTLAVANGGILTHPDMPRAKLNLSDMEPSVALIDSRDGKLILLLRPPSELHRLSLRHLSVNRNGTIAVAAQWEGPKSDLPPLVGVSQNGGPLQLLDAPSDVQIAMRHYCGSVAFSRDDQMFTVTAPRGDTVTYWTSEGQFVRSIALNDGCGTAASEQGFVLTTGEGILLLDTKRIDFPLAWDNHITALG